MKTVLIADDNPSGRELLRTVLEGSGHRVVETVNGREAVKEARHRKFDLIILDLHMPELDGFEVLAELRQVSELAYTPIIALTASAMEGDRGRVIAAGFDGYISKPIRLSDLRVEIERYLRFGSGESAKAAG